MEQNAIGSPDSYSKETETKLVNCILAVCSYNYNNCLHSPISHALPSP